MKRGPNRHVPSLSTNTAPALYARDECDAIFDPSWSPPWLVPYRASQ